MVRHVQNGNDLRDCRFDFDLNSLFECSIRHAAALASAFQANEGRITLDVDERDVTAMAGHGGVDLFVQDNLNSFTDGGV